MKAMSLKYKTLIIKSSLQEEVYSFILTTTVLGTNLQSLLLGFKPIFPVFPEPNESMYII